MSDKKVPKIGEVLSGPGDKDAIHIAVVPVLLGEDFDGGVAGHPVRIVGGKAYRANYGAIGILDPYLTNYFLGEGSWVYMFLNPGSITDLRHEWTLAAFDDNKDPNPIPRLNEESVNWLTNFADDLGASYDWLVIQCKDALESGEEEPYITFGHDIHEYSTAEFWNHFKKATGWKVDIRKAKKIYFSCSC